MSEKKVTDTGGILSLFDHSKVWGGMYEKDGYPVVYWDIKDGHCILERFPIWLKDYNVRGIIAMPPCTDFAGSGARWWFSKDQEGSAECDCCNTKTEHSITLVRATLALVEFCQKTLEWWVLEQPVGRIEKLVPELKKYRRMSFNPCDYGDPWTKRTILYGQFNTSLPKKPVFPLEGSKVHKLWSRKEKTGGLRSLTPKGFAKAFYLANP